MNLLNAESCTESSGEKAFPHECYQQRFAVPFEFPVYFTRDILNPENMLLTSVIDRLNERRRHRVKVFIDSGLVKAVPGTVKHVKTYMESWPDQVKMEGDAEIVPGGEEAKSGWDSAKQTMRSIAESRLCRQSFVIAIGGGSALDIVGLAASLVHRGLRLIRVPTTVLAQNDAGVGVKNGIDEYGMKNFAGTFAPPFAVLIDFQFLRTVIPKYWSGGIAEAFKVAVIKDRDFFRYLCDHATRLRERDETAIETVVKRCAVLHLEHIRNSGDPFELGSARPLDFGHWSAHKLEVLSCYDIGHGQAVSIGIALDSFYASRIGLLSAQERDAIINALETTGLPIWSDLLEARTPEGRLEILRGLDEFQEHMGGQLNITLPEGIGRKVEINKMDPAIIEQGIAFLKRRSSQSQLTLSG